MRELSDYQTIGLTDFSFTGQRGLAAAGLMDYNARFYSPRLGRFISPDTIVPSPGNPQAFNRYAYVINNPLFYIDPSGHLFTSARFLELNFNIGAARQEIPAGWKPYEPDLRADDDGDDEVEPGNLPKEGYHSLKNSHDGHVISITGTAGVGPIFAAEGIDIVITDDEIGVFTTTAAGPWIPNSEKLTGIDHITVNKDSTWVTPQIGLSLLTGPVFGEIEQEVIAYEGTSLKVGGSFTFVSGEVFSSIDEVYGIPDHNVEGYLRGYNIGPQSVIGEIHIYHNNAIYNEFLSTVFSLLRDAILGR